MPNDVMQKKMPEEMRQGISKLKCKFVEELDNRILDFEAALSEFRQGQNGLNAANLIRLQSHNVSGLASSLGFSEIGFAAAEAELSWAEAIKGNLSPELTCLADAATEKLLDVLESTLEPSSSPSISSG